MKLAVTRYEYESKKIEVFLKYNIWKLFLNDFLSNFQTYASKN